MNDVTENAVPENRAWSMTKKVASVAVKGLIVGAVVGVVGILALHAVGVTGGLMMGWAVTHGATHATIAAAATHVGSALLSTANWIGFHGFTSASPLPKLSLRFIGKVAAVSGVVTGAMNGLMAPFTSDKSAPQQVIVLQSRQTERSPGVTLALQPTISQPAPVQTVAVEYQTEPLSNKWQDQINSGRQQLAANQNTLS